MDKDMKRFLIIALIAFSFVIGLKLGENHVICHQHIEQTATGFQVEFDGDYYEYN